MRYPAFGDPGERSVLRVSQRSFVQLRIGEHERLDGSEIVGVYGVLELFNGVQVLD